MSVDNYEIGRQVASKFHFDQESLNQAIAGQFWQVSVAAQAVQYEMMRPSVLFRPALSLDGDQFCALYGANLQDGCAGFGSTPEEAMLAFDKAWAGSEVSE